MLYISGKAVSAFCFMKEKYKNMADLCCTDVLVI